MEPHSPESGRWQIYLYLPSYARAASAAGVNKTGSEEVVATGEAPALGAWAGAAAAAGPEACSLLLDGAAGGALLGSELCSSALSKKQEDPLIILHTMHPKRNLLGQGETIRDLRTINLRLALSDPGLELIVVRR